MCVPPGVAQFVELQFTVLVLLSKPLRGLLPSTHSPPPTTQPEDVKETGASEHTEPARYTARCKWTRSRKSLRVPYGVNVPHQAAGELETRAIEGLQHLFFARSSKNADFVRRGILSMPNVASSPAFRSQHDIRAMGGASLGTLRLLA